MTEKVFCATCKFWEEFNPVILHEHWKTGRCRRLPPRLSEGLLFGPYYRWPRTDEDDWCGEHLPRTPEPEDRKS